jgi:hypothetical protein
MDLSQYGPGVNPLAAAVAGGARPPGGGMNGAGGGYGGGYGAPSPQRPRMLLAGWVPRQYPGASSWHHADAAPFAAHCAANTGRVGASVSPFQGAPSPAMPSALPASALNQRRSGSNSWRRRWWVLKTLKKVLKSACKSDIAEWFAKLKGARLGPAVLRCLGAASSELRFQRPPVGSCARIRNVRVQCALNRWPL